MRHDLYQAETELIAREQSALIDEARVRIMAGRWLLRSGDQILPRTNRLRFSLRLSGLSAASEKRFCFAL